MAKLLFPAIMLVLLTLAACADPAPTAVVEPSPTPPPSRATPIDTQPEPAQPITPTEEPPARPTEAPATPPEHSAPSTTLEPEPPETNVPAPTISATPIPTETPVPTATHPPAATAVRAQEPTPTPTTIPPRTPTQTTSMWRGLTVAPEYRCSDYNSDDYHYPPSVEPMIVDAQGGIYGPYTGTWFDSVRATDIEHIVARSEAHDGGLCAASPDTRGQFASDLLNLTLASPSVNRHQKVAKDAAEWLPKLNHCWYVYRVVQVRQEYGLTIDREEADAIDTILAGCESTEMIVLAPRASATTTATREPTATAVPNQIPTAITDMDALAMYDDNENGRITCAEARAHGIAPVHREHPAYEFMRDADGDGVVCE